MLSSFEILVFILYMCMLSVSLAAITVLNPGKGVRETFVIEDKGERFVQPEFEEPESDSSSEEEYTMTENPMLRHRVNTNDTSAAGSGTPAAHVD